MTDAADVADVLHAAGIPGFTYDPAVDPPTATVHAADMGSGTPTWWASCKRCWWWCEDTHANHCRDEAEALSRANVHNLAHHRHEIKEPRT